MNEEEKNDMPSVRNIALVSALIIVATAVWSIVDFFTEQKANNKHLVQTVEKRDGKIDSLNEDVVSLNKEIHKQNEKILLLKHEGGE